MIFRVKFRVHDGPNPGKYSFNASTGTPLSLNSEFRPAGESEKACYRFEVFEGFTKVTMLDRNGTWNGKPTPEAPFEVRAGHLLASSSVTIEILECPDVSGTKSHERTQFLDLSSLAGFVPAATAPAKSTVPPPMRGDLVGMIPREQSVQAMKQQFFSNPEIPQPVRKEEPAKAEPAKEVAAKTPSNAPLRAPAAADSTSFPEPYDCDPVTTTTERPPPGFTPRPGAVLEDANVISLRRKTVRQAAITAAIFAVLIFGANQYAKLRPFEFEELEVSYPIVRHAVRPMTEREILEARARAAEAAPEPAPKVAETATSKELMSAIEEGDLPLVKRLVDAGGENAAKSLDELGRTPFVRAAAAGRLGVLQYLLSKKVYRDSVDYRGNNALMWSAINGHDRTVAFLLNAGMNPASKREDGMTALALAKHHHQKAIELLLSGPQRGVASVPAKRK